MPKIIVFGDIDISTLYLKIDDGKDFAVKGKRPKSFTIPAGVHHIFATTVTKIERTANRFSDGGFVSNLTAVVQNSTNTTLSGELNFEEDDVLLIGVEQKGLKTVVYNKLVSAAEVGEFVDLKTIEEFNTKKSGKKIILWILALIVVALIFVFLRVYFATSYVGS